MTKNIKNYDDDFKYDCLLKIVILGDSGVGKSNIINRYISNDFFINPRSTIGVEFYTKKFLFNDKQIKIQIWDTAGQERFRSITSSYYRNVNGILLVYDITDQNSFNNITKWLVEIKTNIDYELPILLVGNKIDLEYKRKISILQGTELAYKLNIKFAEMSAFTNTNIVSSMDDFIEHIYMNMSKNNNNNNNNNNNKINFKKKEEKQLSKLLHGQQCC